MERAHPRSRGEHQTQGQRGNCCEGSSPLARGTLASNSCAICRFGLIPARAGNTNSSVSSETRQWAHPRSRGEHGAGWVPARVAEGSSPLARGTLRSDLLAGVGMGLIPARAGNTRQRRSGADRSGAHPRSRGEHLIARAELKQHLGSSPLARGTPLPGLILIRV